MTTDVSFATLFISLMLAMFLGAGAVMWAFDERHRRDDAVDLADELAGEIDADDLTAADMRPLEVATAFHAQAARAELRAAGARVNAERARYERAIMSQARVNRP
jgi:hypothetical protein